MAGDSECGAGPSGSAPRLAGPGRARYVAVVAGGSVSLLVAVTMAISLGPVSVAGGTVWKVIGYHMFGVGDPYTWTDVDESIVWVIRTPRVLLGALVGAGLSIVGVTTQALVRNPLADPFLLGISSGAGLGAVAVIVGTAGGALSVSGGAFIGAMLTFGIVYSLARRGGRMAPLRLVLAGVAVAYVASGLTTWLVMRADLTAGRSAMFWLQGSLAGSSWSDLGIPSVVLAAGMVALVSQARRLNGLVLGDETAASLGISVEQFRRMLFVLSSLIVAVLVALTGGIGFVGLIVPHASRMLVGTDHRRVLIVSAILGATFLVLVDLVCRVIVAPGELPIGVLTSVVGGPVFLWLMRRSDAKRGEV